MKKCNVYFGSELLYQGLEFTNMEIDGGDYNDYPYMFYKDEELVAIFPSKGYGFIFTQN